MILTRQGNKRRIAPLIIPHFPAHDIYIEPFFGAGGLFFSKLRKIEIAERRNLNNRRTEILIVNYK